MDFALGDFVLESDSTLIATGWDSQTRRLHRVNLDTGDSQVVYEFDHGRVGRLAIDPDGRVIAAYNPLDEFGTYSQLLRIDLDAGTAEVVSLPDGLGASDLDVLVVPEPWTITLLITGVLGTLTIARRHRANVSTAGKHQRVKNQTEIPRQFLQACLVLGAVLSLCPAAAEGKSITWTGEGHSGTDPYGKLWSIGHGSTDMADWTMPGMDTYPWDGPEILTEFHITFSGLPPGTTIGTEANHTLFRLWPWGNTWNAEVDDESLSVSFTAADPEDRLDPEEQYFTRIRIWGSAPFEAADVSFAAEYVMVPEPSSLVLLGLGVIGLICGHRRRCPRRCGPDLCPRAIGLRPRADGCDRA